MRPLLLNQYIALNYFMILLLALLISLALCLQYKEYKDDQLPTSIAFLKSLTNKQRKEIFQRRTPTGYGVDYMQLANKLSPFENYDLIYVPDRTAFHTFQDLFEDLYTRQTHCNPFRDEMPDRHFGIVKPQDLNIDPRDAQLLNRTVKSTRIRLARNLAGYPLPPTTTAQQLAQIQEKFLAAAKKLPTRFQGQYYRVADLSEDEVFKMMEKGLMFDVRIEPLKVSGCYGHWPIGRGAYISHDKKFIVWLNEEDQFRINFIEQGGDIVHIYSQLIQAMKILDEELGFDYGKQIGFYASSPLNSGTGMRISYMVRLENYDDEELRQEAEGVNLELRGSQGFGSEAEDHYFQICNHDLVCPSVASLIRKVSKFTAQRIRRNISKGKA